MKIPIYQVDAFTNKMFKGNPAAVCFLESWISDDIMQKIAAENNLAETAFLVGDRNKYDLRWFTPKIEVDLCGHATLASAFVIFTFLYKNLNEVQFKTASGKLIITRSNNLLSMDFPSRKPVSINIPELLSKALGITPVEVLKSRDLLAIYKTEDEIRKIKPDFDKLKEIKETNAVIISAPGDFSDFVSRFFAPKMGVPEDPVTGSAHCTLIPFWSKRLKKTELHALQLSNRGGELFCEDLGERVRISGNAVLYTRGEILL